MDSTHQNRIVEKWTIYIRLQIDIVVIFVSYYKKAEIFFCELSVTHYSPSLCHTNIWGPRGPRKSVKASQTIIIGI